MAAFNTGLDYLSGGLAVRALAFADLNGDTQLDMVVVNRDSDNVSVLFAQGNANFSAPIFFAAGTKPNAIRIADFNKDSKQDIAVTNDNGNVSLLLGNGNGTFAAPTSIAVATTPVALATGDVNGDSNLDIVAANNGSANVSLLLGNGNGTFLPATNIAVGTNPTAVRLADFNGDSKLDMATSNATGLGVSVLLGNGNGTFQAPTNLTAGLTPSALDTRDLNGDSKIDITVANGGGDNVTVLLGNGNGTFGAGANFAVGKLPSWVDAGDFNKDGKLDLAVTNQTDNNVSVLTGNGNGTFLPAVNFSANEQPVQVAVTDIGNDGNLDLATANLGTRNVTAILGNGNGTFRSPQNAAAGDNLSYVVTADFNGDSKSDYAVVNQLSPVSKVRVFLGNGNGTFQAPLDSDAGKDAFTAAVAEFNGDGKLDLAVTNFASNQVSILLGNGNGTFQAPITKGSGAMPVGIFAADFNGDGKQDVAMADIAADALQSISVMLGNGNGTLQDPAFFAGGPNPNSLTAADFDGDGKLDIAATNSATNNKVTILLGNGNGTFKAGTSMTAGPAAVFVVNGDFNGDSKQDLAVANNGNTTASIFLGNGNGTFAAPVDNPAAIGPNGLATADFNRDGKLDLAVSNLISNDVTVLLGNGNGAFAPNFTYLADAAGFAMAVAAADFNADGFPDIVTSNGKAKTSSVLINVEGTATALTSSANPAVFGQPVILTATVTPTSAGRTTPTGDVNFFDGTTNIGKGTLNAQGVATLTVSTLSVASHNLTARYAGDAKNFTSVSNVVSQSVAQAATTLSIVVSPNPVRALGDFIPQVTITATATTVAPGVGVPTGGTVVFFLGTTPIGGEDLVKGKATVFRSNVFSVGVNVLTAEYRGGLNFLGSTSPPVELMVVVPTQTSVALSSSANPTGVGQSIQFTALVSPGGLLGQNTPSGTITFFDGTTSLGTVQAVQTSPTPGPFSQATGFLTVTLSPGSHNITATYNGNGQFTASTSPVLVQIVQGAAGAGETPNDNFIGALYVALLNRSATSTDLTYWSAALASGATRTQIVQAIESSLEFRTLVVQNGYQSILGRPADPAGLIAFVNFLATGTTQQFRASLFGSTEFFAKSGGTNAGFVQGVYLVALKRAPTPAETQLWVVQLLSGVSTYTVATAIQRSVESDILNVQLVYQTLLHRPADPLGQAFFVSALQQGATIEQVIAAIGGGIEFYNAQNQAFYTAYVASLYNTLLLRSPGAGETAYWVGVLNLGVSPTSVVLQIESSPEFLALTVQRQLYNTYLHRPADPAGLALFVNLLATGTSFQQAAVIMTASPEFFATQGGGTNRGFLQALYQNALGQPIDPVVLASLTVALDNGSTTRTAVATDLFASVLYDSAVVKQIYLSVLKREADFGGLTVWVSAIQQGASFAQVIAEIASSPEYFQKVS